MILQQSRQLVGDRGDLGELVQPDVAKDYKLDQDHAKPNPAKDLQKNPNPVSDQMGLTVQMVVNYLSEIFIKQPVKNVPKCFVVQMDIICPKAENVSS